MVPASAPAGWADPAAAFVIDGVAASSYLAGAGQVTPEPLFRMRQLWAVTAAIRMNGRKRLKFGGIWPP
jgi:hypothetical protein